MIDIEREIYFIEKQIDELYKKNPLNWSDKELRDYIDYEHELRELRNRKEAINDKWLH